MGDSEDAESEQQKRHLDSIATETLNKETKNHDLEMAKLERELQSKFDDEMDQILRESEQQRQEQILHTVEAQRRHETEELQRMRDKYEAGICRMRRMQRAWNPSRRRHCEVTSQTVPSPYCSFDATSALKSSSLRLRPMPECDQTF